MAAVPVERTGRTPEPVQPIAQGRQNLPHVGYRAHQTPQFPLPVVGQYYREVGRKEHLGSPVRDAFRRKLRAEERACARVIQIQLGQPAPPVPDKDMWVLSQLDIIPAILHSNCKHTWQERQPWQTATSEER